MKELRDPARSALDLLRIDSCRPPFRVKGAVATRMTAFRSACPVTDEGELIVMQPDGTHRRRLTRNDDIEESRQERHPLASG